jgi:hypothetical protein
MAEIRQVTIKVRDRQVDGGTVPSSAVMAEPFVNLYNGVLRFSGVTGGDYEPSPQAGVFEVGSKLYNSTITNRLNINNNFIISGDTGIISTYEGTTSLAGKFLSGGTTGLVLADISDIAGASAGNAGDVQFNDGSDGFAADGNFNYNNSTDTLSVPNLSANTFSANTSIFSGGTSLETIIYNISSTVTGNHTKVQPGSNILTGGTALLPIISTVASPSFNIVSASGHVSTNGTTYSGGTIVDDGIFTIDAATQVEVNSDLLPAAHLTYDLGAVGQRWDEVFARKVRLGTSSTTLEDQLFSSTTGNFLFDFAGDLLIDNNVLPNANLSYDLGSKTGSRWNTVYAQDLDLAGALSTTGITDSSLTAGRVVYVGVGGALTDEAGFEYDAGANLLKTANIQIGDPTTTGNTTTTIFGNVVIVGDAFSATTSELYIEDNNITLNFNPTASTVSTSLGSGWSIQDGSGSDGTDVLFDIRGAATGLANRSFSTNLFDIRIRETGTVSSPNGLRLIAESDIIDGGSY